MRQRAAVAEVMFVEREVQRRILHVELCIAGSHFARLKGEELLIKLNASLDVVHVQGKVRLQNIQLLLFNHFSTPSYMSGRISTEYRSDRYICQGIYAKLCAV